MPWLRMFNKFPDRKVYAEVDEQGEPVVNKGLVRIRYKLDDARTYTAAARNLKPVPGRTPQTSSVPISDTPAPKRRTNKTTSSAASIDIPTTPPPGVVLAFTDGACHGNPGPAGLGVVLAFGKHRKEIAESLGEATNNIAELTAILRALEAIKTPAKPVHLYTDSSYAIGVLAKGWKARANKDLVTAIRERMKTFANLQLFKVKGHAGHLLNERADTLATEAIAAAAIHTTDTPRRTEHTYTADDPSPSPAATSPTSDTRHTPTFVERPPAIPDAPPDADTLLIFTDGACTGNPGPAGWGAVLIHGDDHRELSGYIGEGTNNIAELTAILEALRAAPDPHQRIHLYSDSSYALGLLAKGWKAKANKDLVAALRSEVARFSDLTFFKVKGHAGHPLNEAVDELARTAILTRPS